MSLFISVCLCALVSAYAHAIRVNTTEGVVEGYKAGDGDYFAFYGIPYAGPVDGNNRFKGPVPPSPYPGDFHAIDSNIICAQPSTRGLIGVENCLTLSIFTKNVTTSSPTIVWLNSEEYTTSNTHMFSFKRFVEEQIVFISVNFRLSVFGFLCLGVEEAPGNAGLKDVVQALKWINANVNNFGGDPKNVVLMGHGSGAAMVDLLTMKPNIQGLFHKAIALSGSALAPWAVTYDPVGYAELLGEKLGYSGKSREDLAKHLVTTDVFLLRSALIDFNFKNNTPLFAPCIETLNANDTVVTAAPYNLLRAGSFLPVPYIAGYTTMEGTLRASEAVFGDWLNAMQANFSDFLQVDLDLRDNKSSVADAIREFYFSKSPIDMGTIEDYLDYQGDTLVVVPVIRGAQERSRHSVNDVRLLKFGYIGTLNSDWIYNQIPLKGVKHGGFLNYLFDYDLRQNDEAVMQSIVKRLASFAYTGAPDLITARNTSSSTWRPITKDQLNYFYYGGSDEVSFNRSAIYVEETRFDPHNMTMNFWNSFFDKYYAPPRAASSSTKVFSSISFVLLCHLMTSFKYFYEDC